MFISFEGRFDSFSKASFGSPGPVPGTPPVFADLRHFVSDLDMSTFEKTVKKGPIGAELCTPICAPFLCTRRVIYTVLVCYITVRIAVI